MSQPFSSDPVWIWTFLDYLGLCSLQHSIAPLSPHSLHQMLCYFMHKSSPPLLYYLFSISVASSLSWRVETHRQQRGKTSFKKFETWAPMLLYWLESQRLNACRLKFIRKHKSLQCSINEGQFVQFLFCPKSIFLFHCVIGNVFLVLPIVKKGGRRGIF